MQTLWGIQCCNDVSVPYTCNHVDFRRQLFFKHHWDSVWFRLRPCNQIQLRNPSDIISLVSFHSCLQPQQFLQTWSPWFLIAQMTNFRLKFCWWHPSPWYKSIASNWESISDFVWSNITESSKQIPFQKNNKKEEWGKHCSNE